MININESKYNHSQLNDDYTPIQLKLPLDLSIIINIDDPVYTFDKVMKGLDLKKYLVTKNKDSRGRCGYNSVKLLKVILFGFMIGGYQSLRELESLCKNDIRFMWLLDGENDYPSFMTFSNFINEHLTYSVEDIFNDINKYIINLDNVDTEHIYIDGTKLEANANKYSWVWKKACITSRDKLYLKITNLLNEINSMELEYLSVKFDTRDQYAIEYMENIVTSYYNELHIDCTSFVYGKGKRKTRNQRNYELLVAYTNKLKDYATKIETCGEHRNSFSKTDKSATFMRIKKDYMGNDQLLPSYNLQIGVCDEYIMVADINQYASDSDCFIPLMEKYKKIFNKYPLYPVGDAGYGSYNNYIFCEKNGMNKYMKFSMYKKETTNEKYSSDIFRPINFKRDESGNLVCPNNKKFIFFGTKPIKNNKYGRVYEKYQCEDCTNCKLKSKCHASKDNRIITLNDELTSFHKEVINNLQSSQGSLLRMNRSIQVEGTFGILKHDRKYKRIVRKGLESVKLEIFLVSIGHNLYKLHNKLNRKTDMIC